VWFCLIFNAVLVSAVFEHTLKYLIDEPGQVEDPGSHCKYIPATAKRSASSTRTSGPCPRSAGLLVPAPPGQAPGQGSSSSWDLLSLERVACPCVNAVPNRNQVEGMSKETRLICVLLHTYNIYCSFHALLFGLCWSQGFSHLWINKGREPCLALVNGVANLPCFISLWHVAVLFSSMLEGPNGRIDIFGTDEVTQILAISL